VIQLILLTFLVEDNPGIRKNLIETLEDITTVKVVHWCDNELDAKRWLTDNVLAWDMVILDIFLKQGNGLGVIKMLSNRGSDRKVVVLSNYATPEMRKRCLTLGADRVFDKSSELEDLVRYCQCLSLDEMGG
jgi:two-component system, OmpR family, response regulator